MRIRDIINEAKQKPDDDELEPNDELDNDELDSADDELDDDETDDDDRAAALEDFVELAGNLGNDLYSITMYDYSNEFSSIGPNSRVYNLLNKFSDDPVIAQYLGVGEMQISDDKIVSAVILNDRVGKFFAYYSGDGVEGFSPQESVQGLVAAGIISSDQVALLQNIKSSGMEYNKIVSNTYWNAGEEAGKYRDPEKEYDEYDDYDDYDDEDEDYDDINVYDALDSLTSALSLPDLPQPIRALQDYELSDEQRERNKKRDDAFQAAMDASIAKYLAKQANIKKTKGAGREKR